MKSDYLTTSLIAVCLLAGASSAEQAVKSVSDVATIEDGEGNARILFHWEPSIPAEHYTVGRAALVLPLQGEPEDRVIQVQVYPVTTAWSADNVSWSSGWTTPGGDFEENILSRTEIDLKGGSESVVLDISSVVKETLEQNLPANGYLITTTTSEGSGFNEEDVSRFSGLANASIEMVWRKVPPKPIELQENDDVEGN